MVRTRLDVLDRDIDLILARDLSPRAQSARIAEVAREELAMGQARNRSALGYLPKHQTFVDRRKDAPLETVRPDGVIVFEFELIETALGAIAEMLILASPVRSGRYQASHALFADGVEVEPGQIPPNAREFAFVNSQPYARKIERGLSPQSPEGVYHVVATMASRRFGNMARIKFGFRSLPAGAIGGWARSGSALALARRVRGGNPERYAEWLTRQPAVIITPGGGR